MLRETVEVLLLLGKLGLESDELLLLALADGVVLVGLLTALESITNSAPWSAHAPFGINLRCLEKLLLPLFARTQNHPAWMEHQYLPRPWCEQWWKRQPE